jgi:hypothetical protein
MTARSDHSDLTTCDWTDEFCDCRDLGTIYSLITEEELCARHYLEENGANSANVKRGLVRRAQEASRDGPSQPEKT